MRFLPATYHFCFRQFLAFAVFFFFVCQSMAFAALPASLIDIRFGAARNRVVFTVSRVPVWNVSVEEDGKRIVLDLDGIKDRSEEKPSIRSRLIRSASIEDKPGGVRVIFEMARPATYEVHTLSDPTRLYLDIMEAKAQSPKAEKEKSDKGDEAKPQAQQPKPKPQQPAQLAQPAPVEIGEQEMAPGLTYSKYVRRDGRGMLTAHLLIADHKKYRLFPALANGQIVGRQTVSGIAAANGADAAINTSYFDPSGSLIGITKMDGSVVGTMYIPRTAVGMMPDGSLFFGVGSYQGTVTIGDVTLPVGGVDCERGENSLVLYDSHFARSTRTNEYGMEYLVQDGRVTAINQANSRIPKDGIVVSVHGTSKDALKGVRVGDKADIQQELGTPWNDAVWIQGAGPRLVQNGRISVTAGNEKFPSDISYGRAPRTAFGVTRDGDYIFVVADGRQASSIGCTLTELADLMKEFGAVDAMNFDGGGSSEMVIGGDIANNPSDGSERRVGCALLLKEREDSE